MRLSIDFTFEQRLQIRNNVQIIFEEKDNKLLFKAPKKITSTLSPEEIMYICGYNPLIYGISVNVKVQNDYLVFNLML